MRSQVTRASEGFDRRAFTVAEVLRMQDAGVISQDESFEQIEGESAPMQAAPDEPLAFAALPGFSIRLANV